MIRKNDEKRSGILQKIYPKPDEFLDDETPNIEIMYNSVRFFFYIIISYLLMNKFKETFRKYWGSWFTDPVLNDMVKSINEDYYFSISFRIIKSI